MQVFVSYAAQDGSELARRLTEALTARGVDVWFDQAEVLPGDNLHLAISDALSDSEALVVLMTPAAVASRSVQSEIDYAMGSKAFKGRLLPILVGTSPDDLPWVLRKYRWLSFDEAPDDQALEQVADEIRRTAA